MKKENFYSYQWNFVGASPSSAYYILNSLHNPEFFLRKLRGKACWTDIIEYHSFIYNPFIAETQSKRNFPLAILPPR